MPEKIGVLIASYRRFDFLAPCLKSLEKQIRLPDQVIVIVRNDDVQTQEGLASLGVSYPLTIVHVSVPGTVAARNAGLDVSICDVIAILDDDTLPYPQWLDVILKRFQADPSLGGLGGRDRCHDGHAFDDNQHETVGKIQWYGRLIGNHHLGFGGIRDVDFLKGANMSFRSEAIRSIRFDARLKGRGAQPGEDIAFSVAVKADGWRLAYDPAALIDHFAGRRDEVRQYVGVQSVKDKDAFRDFAYNEVVSVWAALSAPRRVAFFLWSIGVGTGTCPGFVQAVRFTPRLGKASWVRFGIAQGGKLAAFRDLVR